MLYKTGRCIDCGKEGPVISDRCRYHYWKHRDAINGRRKIKRSKRIKKVSEGRIPELHRYARIRQENMLKREVCEARLPGCTIKVTDIHHKAGRMGKLLTDETYFLYVCRSCHDLIERFPRMAKEKGFSVSRLNK